MIFRFAVSISTTPISMISWEGPRGGGPAQNVDSVSL